MLGAVCHQPGVSRGTLWAVFFQFCSWLVSLQAACSNPETAMGWFLCGQLDDAACLRPGWGTCSGDPPETGCPWGVMSQGSDGCHAKEVHFESL